MSMSALLSALRGASRPNLSASIVSAKMATFSHVLRIEGFTQVRKMVSNGKGVRSSTFTVGGHDWRIKCYPNGSAGHDGYISLFLEHASHAKTIDAMVQFQLSILDNTGSSMPSSSTEPITEHSFSSTNPLSLGWSDFMKHEDLDEESHLKDDCLTLLCDATVTRLHTDADEYIEVAAALEPAPVAPTSFDLPVDVKIEAGGETFHAHRWVLEARSPVFKKELSLASMATGTAELRVDDMDAEMFRTLLQFIYTDSPPLLEAAPTAEKLLVAADRYGVEKLKRICEEALCKHIDISSLAATLELAERHRCTVLTAACMQFLYNSSNLKAFVAADGINQLKGRFPSTLLKLLGKN
ncbi:BTB/POZ and MATH domain-containing protein 1-like [Lolium rigidum]|uniref:BTB/POZ and MATH domain-containing protein 1-like n=1 Tax=Lolium rigidum TaxID=89674 RepID=UPI001F5E2993|nr:BTB/POZ and MATH domain-containing protein 1-like [Lolium rigidum]